MPGGRSWASGAALASMLASIVLACACGSPAPSGPDGGAGTTQAPATASAFCAEVRRRDAAVSARCNGGDQADWRAWNDTVGTCEALDRFVAKGTIRYHRERAAACLEELHPDRDCFAASTCYLETVEGLLPAGARCSDAYECPVVATCAAPGFVVNACEVQTCLLFPGKAGDTCRDLPICFASNLSCVKGVCVDNLAEGAPCGDGLPSCRAGLYCDAAAGICTRRAASGPCADDSGCLPTHFCGGGACTPRLAVGASCADAPTGCMAFASCNPTALVCEHAGHAGQVCAASDGSPVVCVDGPCLTNVDGTSSCIARQAIGAACGTGDECLSGGCRELACATCTL